MRFRPCIDIHNGKVKQIVGSSLSDEDNSATENFVSERSAGYYAAMFREMDLPGGHAIILNKKGTPEYDASLKTCFEALSEYPGGLQVGGGINADNAGSFIEAGASHIIVTSFVFNDGRIDMDNLRRISETVLPGHLVLDLSCKNYDGTYFVMTDRWQKKTDAMLSASLLDELSEYCDEFLIHAVDSEGKAKGPEMGVLEILKDFNKRPVTYAGGIASYSDVELIGNVCGKRVDVTIGSALDIYGGSLEIRKVTGFCAG